MHREHRGRRDNFANDLADNLRERGESITCVSKAHLNVAIIEGSIAQRRVSKGRHCFTMGWALLSVSIKVQLPLGSELVKLRYCPDVRFIIVGDMDNRSEPMGRNVGSRIHIKGMTPTQLPQLACYVNGYCPFAER